MRYHFFPSTWNEQSQANGLIDFYLINRSTSNLYENSSIDRRWITKIIILFVLVCYHNIVWTIIFSRLRRLLVFNNMPIIGEPHSWFSFYFFSFHFSFSLLITSIDGIAAWKDTNHERLKSINLTFEEFSKLIIYLWAIMFFTVYSFHIQYKILEF